MLTILCARLTNRLMVRLSSSSGSTASMALSSALPNSEYISVGAIKSSSVPSAMQATCTCLSPYMRFLLVSMRSSVSLPVFTTDSYTDRVCPMSSSSAFLSPAERAMSRNLCFKSCAFMLSASRLFLTMRYCLRSSWSMRCTVSYLDCMFCSVSWLNCSCSARKQVNTL